MAGIPQLGVALDVLSGVAPGLRESLRTLRQGVNGLQSDIASGRLVECEWTAGGVVYVAHKLGRIYQAALVAGVNTVGTVQTITPELVKSAGKDPGVYVGVSSSAVGSARVWVF